MGVNKYFDNKKKLTFRKTNTSMSINSIIKQLSSYTKSKWKFNDYPLSVKYEKGQFDSGNRWYARIENWDGMYTSAYTKKEAIDRLKGYFTVATLAKIPRPGTKYVGELTKHKELDKYGEIPWDFLKNVLTPNVVLHTRLLFISDFSALPNYEGYSGMSADKYREFIISRTRQYYEIDISDLFDGPLYKVFERIQQSGHTA